MAIFMAVSFSACSDDDDDNKDGLDSKLVGSWYDEDEEDYTNMTFKSDGKFTIESEEYGEEFKCSGTWSTSDGKLNMHQTWNSHAGDVSLKITYRYEVNGSYLHLYYDGNTYDEEEETVLKKR